MADSAALRKDKELEGLAQLIHAQHLRLLRQATTIHVFVDWDYMLAASKLVDPSASALDPNIHLDIPKLVQLIEDDRPVGTRHLTSTKLPPSTAAYTLWRRHGYFIHNVRTEMELNPILFTCATDCFMDLDKYKPPPPPPSSSSDGDGSLYLLDGAPKKSKGSIRPPPAPLELKTLQTLVLVIGNSPCMGISEDVANPQAASFVRLIKRALKSGWRVEVWTWQGTVMTGIDSIENVEINYFNNHRKDITFYKTVSGSDDPHMTFL